MDGSGQHKLRQHVLNGVKIGMASPKVPKYIPMLNLAQENPISKIHSQFFSGTSHFGTSAES